MPTVPSSSYVKQYTSTTLLKDYRITLEDNLMCETKLQQICELSFHQFTTHCGWILSSVFHSYNPGEVNQQIIQTDQHQLGHHTTICYCSHNITNCSVNVLGAVYHGQMLLVELCTKGYW